MQSVRLSTPPPEVPGLASDSGSESVPELIEDPFGTPPLLVPDSEDPEYGGEMEASSGAGAPQPSTSQQLSHALRTQPPTLLSDDEKEEPLEGAPVPSEPAFLPPGTLEVRALLRKATWMPLLSLRLV